MVYKREFCLDVPYLEDWKTGRLEDYASLAFSLRFPLPGLSYHVGHHVQFLGYSMNEEVFMS